MLESQIRGKDQNSRSRQVTTFFWSLRRESPPIFIIIKIFLVQQNKPSYGGISDNYATWRRRKVQKAYKCRFFKVCLLWRCVILHSEPSLHSFLWFNRCSILNNPNWTHQFEEYSKLIEISRTGLFSRVYQNHIENGKNDW